MWLSISDQVAVIHVTSALDPEGYSVHFRGMLDLKWKENASNRNIRKRDNVPDEVLCMLSVMNENGVRIWMGDNKGRVFVCTTDGYIECMVAICDIPISFLATPNNIEVLISFLSLNELVCALIGFRCILL